jgi:predicted DNA-binding transcriptional regulator AlpA
MKQDEYAKSEKRLPLLLGTRKAAELCGVSPRTWTTHDACGKVPLAVRLGRSRFWRTEELRDWVRAGCPDREMWLEMEPAKKYLRSP